MHIRPYRDADQAAVVALWNESLPPNAPHNDPASSIRRKREYEQDLFFVAEVNGEVVGAVMGGYDGHRGWIYSVAVRPEFRRQGIGRALLTEMERALVRRGCLKINLQVRTSNRDVIAFYEKLGFVVEEIVSMGKRMY